MSPNRPAGKRPPWSPIVIGLLGIAAIAVVVFAIFNKWAVLLLALAAAGIGLGIWAWQKGFQAIEIVAFLIHFDGVEFSIFSIGRAAALVLTVVLARKILVDRWRPPAVPWRNWVPIWLLFGWVALTAAWSGSPGGAIKAFLMLYLGFVFFCVTAMLAESHKDIQRFLRAFWMGGLFGSAAGVLALFLGTRSEGLIGDPNFFGLVQASMIPLTVYYLRNAVDRRQRIVYTLTLIVVLGGAAGAGSRSGLIGGAAAIVLTMVTRPGIGTSKRIRIGAVALLVAPLAFLIGFVVNPNNLERGFSDRGAGRLDFWNVTTDIIRERPLFGQGLGQTQYEIPQRLLITQGVQQLNEKRDYVSSHNTWLDMLSDNGLIGVGLFASCFVIAAWSLLHPRWPYLSELSTTVAVMLAPVFTASMFLPLLNNKLAWSMLGVAAGLSVPSVASRWRSGEGDARESIIRPPRYERQRQVTDSTDVVPYSPPFEQGIVVFSPQALLANPIPIESMPEVDLAKWDLRFTSKMRRIVVASAAGAVIVGYVFGSTLPARYQVSAAFMAPRVDVSFPDDELRLPRERSQKALVLVKSELYASNLIEASGIDRSVEEVLAGLSATKPKMGGLVEIAYIDNDRAVAEAAAPHLVAALSQIYESARAYAANGVNEQSRPMNPGEQNFYDGPPIVAVFSETAVTEVKPKAIWIGLTLGVSVGIFVAGYFLSGSRRPRVLASDDLSTHTGLSVWAHLGAARGEPIEAVVAQSRQLAERVAEESSGMGTLRRIVVAPTERSRVVDDVVIELAGALLLQGERVVVVDGDVDRLGLFRRFAVDSERFGSEEPLNLSEFQLQELSKPAKLLTTGLLSELRLLSGSQLFDAASGQIEATRLGELDESVTVIVVLPPVGSSVGIRSIVEWAQSAVVPLRPGVTSTDDAIAATSKMRLLGSERAGIVLINS